jgi:hypothetical protein
MQHFGIVCRVAQWAGGGAAGARFRVRLPLGERVYGTIFWFTLPAFLVIVFNFLQVQPPKCEGFV